MCERLQLCDYYINGEFNFSSVPVHPWMQVEDYLNTDVTNYVEKLRQRNGGDDSSIMVLMPPGLHVFLSKYILPFQFLFGVVGNFLNLLVLLSRNMRSEANILLSTMAICDIVLMFTMLPFCLGCWSFFYKSDWFRSFYYASHIYNIWFCNFLSCITSWLCLAVSVERYMGIRSPIHFRYHWRTSRIFIIIFIIVIGSGFLTIFHVFEYRYGFALIQNGTMLYGSPININRLDSSQFLKSSIKVLKVLQIIVGVLIPTVGILLLNLQIIRLLRKSEFLSFRSSENGDEQMSRKYSDLDARQKRDLKVTFTVLTIIGCYFITHVPSLLPFVLEVFNLTPEWVTLYGIPLTSSWLITGKVANFVLFCMSSIYFRRRLMALIRGRVGLKRKSVIVVQRQRSSVVYQVHSRLKAKLTGSKDTEIVMKSSDRVAV